MRVSNEPSRQEKTADASDQQQRGEEAQEYDLDTRESFTPQHNDVGRLGLLRCAGSSVPSYGVVRIGNDASGGPQSIGTFLGWMKMIQIRGQTIVRTSDLVVNDYASRACDLGDGTKELLLLEKLALVGFVVDAN